MPKSKYCGAVSLEKGPLLTRIAHHAQEFWVKNADLASTPQRKRVRAFEKIDKRKRRAKVGSEAKIRAECVFERDENALIAAQEG